MVKGVFISTLTGQIFDNEKDAQKCEDDFMSEYTRALLEQDKEELEEFYRNLDYVQHKFDIEMKFLQNL